MTESESTAAHRAAASAAAAPAGWAIVVVSDSRTLETDVSGPLAARLVGEAGHRVVERALLPNDEGRVRGLVTTCAARDDVDVVLCLGGTGLGSRDRTIEAVRPLFDKELPGFGELFRLLSYQEQIGTAAILSRANAGSVNRRLVVALPGSSAACELALTRVLLPELSHLLRELRR